VAIAPVFRPGPLGQAVIAIKPVAATRAQVITHRSAAPAAARELIVSATGLYERGCSPAATVDPPTSRVGDPAEEIMPHHGTRGTTTTVRGPAALTA
jgi:hypothetical protein